MDIIGLAYMGFETPDIESWREYGTQVMGFGIGKTPEADPNSLYFRIDDRRHRLAFHPGKIDRLAYMGWEVTNRTTFKQAIEKFKAAGVEVTPGTEELKALRGVRDLIRFRDPVGFQHELFYGQKWEPRSFVPGRPHGGFNTEGRGFGHAVLIAPGNADEIERFFVDVMGFHWVGSGANNRSAFFRAKLNNATSHDIAYGPAPNRMGIQHIGIFVSSLRDVGETLDIVKKRNLPMQITLGEHTQDPHVSFYHFCPGGFAIETITELKPWKPDGFELNPEKLSSWGHEQVGPIMGTSVRTPEEVLDAEYLATRKNTA